VGGGGGGKFKLSNYSRVTVIRGMPRLLGTPRGLEVTGYFEKIAKLGEYKSCRPFFIMPVARN
jgi:hypothetical protein